MTASIGSWAGGFALGAALGAIHLGLLWLAVRALADRSRSPWGQVLAFGAQALLRIGVVMAGLLAAIGLGAGAVEILLAVAGFVAARVTATTLVRRTGREGA